MKLFHNNSEILNDKTQKSYDIQNNNQLKEECDSINKTIDNNNLIIDDRK